MSHKREPALVRAEILARIHYGLPPVRPSLSGHTMGAHKTVLAKLEREGFADSNGVTDQGYREIEEVCRIIRLIPLTRCTGQTSHRSTEPAEPCKGEA